MSERHRKPSAFRLDDPDVIVAASPDEARKRDARTVLLMQEIDAALPVPAAPAKPARRGLRWGTLFWTAFGGLVLLGLGLAITNLIEDLFARSETLGYVGLALAALAGLSLAAVIARETYALSRLARIEHLHQRAQAILVSDDRVAGQTLVRDLLGFERGLPQLARARADLETHLGEIIDGADLVRLAERKLMAPLDVEARRLVSNAAKRVSVVTAVSPRAAVDMLFVLGTALALIRRLALLYGGRPGTLGLIRLARMVVAHLAVTGGVAAGDSLIQQVIGHGVAAKLSARLGEGVLNGLLTARVGLAAIEVARPLPFAALPRPSVTDLAGDLVRRRETDVTDRPSPPD